MNHIMSMMFLGLLAGMFATFWTRITKKNMIFRRFGKWMEQQNNSSFIMTNKPNPWVRFIQCSFCLSPWLVLVLELFYVVEFNPYWIYAYIGILGGLGSGNLVAEIVHCLRNEE